ncbi:hypothetical protein KXQ82_09005 [Mucilaginibacter sp. HMF5004]|uniref:hypothetical protein n=1 Tax=Mucilaginibacter rivuli TaxID=2857527 RepID=UPI001C5DCD18|nr:hypothetical protein [Mucilaginibacter rivuli]MBW4889853.1 hypothetical protein [Mucilaginibacter rivuli]
MIKASTITFICLLFIVPYVQAQTMHRDSVTKIARDDARNFKLNENDKERFKLDKDNYSSDFFKPTDKIASDNKLLQDSVYVKAFRAAAYSKARGKRSLGHNVLVGVGIYVVASAVAAVVVLVVLFNSAAK